VKHLRTEATALKEALAELLMENHLPNKSVIGDGEDDIQTGTMYHFPARI